MVDAFNQSVSNQGIDPEEMVAVQKDMLLDEDSELNGETFDVVLVGVARSGVEELPLTPGLSVHKRITTFLISTALLSRFRAA